MRISSTAYAPEGENYDSSGTDLSFTGQKQDIAGGQYDFLFREYSPVQGRWWTPDPAGRPGVWPALPGAGMSAAAALPLAPFGPGVESAEGVAIDAVPCTSGDFGSSGGCTGGVGSQSAATADNLELGSATSDSIPNPFAAVNPNDPQTWDRYAYAGGSPSAAADLFGLLWCQVGRVAAVSLSITGGVGTFFGWGVPLSIAGWYLGGAVALSCGEFY